MRHPQPAGRSKPPKRSGSLGRDEDAAGEDSIGRAEGIREAANACARAGAEAEEGREPQQQLGWQLHVLAYIWMELLGPVAPLDSSPERICFADRIRKRRGRGRGGEKACSKAATRRAGGVGGRRADAAPRRAVSSSRGVGAGGDWGLECGASGVYRLHPKASAARTLGSVAPAWPTGCDCDCGDASLLDRWILI